MRIHEVLTKKQIREHVSNDDIQALRDNGYELIDSIEIGQYNIAVTRIPDMMQPMIGAEYQLGFSKNDTQFTDYSQHDQKFVSKGEKFPLSELSKGMDTITIWIDRYGPMVVGSSNQQKTNTYKRLFKRAGFKIHEMNMMGFEYFIIE